MLCNVCENNPCLCYGKSRNPVYRCPICGLTTCSCVGNKDDWNTVVGTVNIDRHHYIHVCMDGDESSHQLVPVKQPRPTKGFSSYRQILRERALPYFQPSARNYRPSSPPPDSVEELFCPEVLTRVEIDTINAAAIQIENEDRLRKALEKAEREAKVRAYEARLRAAIEQDKQKEQFRLAQLHFANITMQREEEMYADFDRYILENARINR